MIWNPQSMLIAAVIAIGIALLGAAGGWSVGRAFLDASHAAEFRELDKTIAEQQLSIARQNASIDEMKAATLAAGRAREIAETNAAAWLAAGAKRKGKAENTPAADCSETMAYLWELRQ